MDKLISELLYLPERLSMAVRLSAIMVVSSI